MRILSDSRRGGDLDAHAPGFPLAIVKGKPDSGHGYYALANSPSRS